MTTTSLRYQFKSKMGKYSLIFFLILILRLTTVPSVYAVCPLCTAAVGAGLGFSRWLGIDDAVTSIWIGGMLASVSFWTISWLGKKRFNFLEKFKENHITFLSFAFWYSLTLVPLWLTGIIGHPFNTILGMDKILFGTAAGSLVFLVGMWADKRMRKIRGKQLFVYQKVVFPVVSLVIISLVIYYYGGYLY
jgi:hypothetical protein